MDGSAITALLVLVNTLVLLWTRQTVRATHDAVNGMQAGKVTDAHQAGVVEGARAIPESLPGNTP